jgi:ribosome-associated protein
MAKTPAKKTNAKKSAKKAPAKKAVSKKVAQAAKEAMVREKEINKLSKDKAAPKKKAATKPKGIRPERSSKSSTADQALILAKTVAQGMFEKKAEDIRILDMRNVKGASADFFVISHAESDKQVEAIANSADEETRKILDEKPWHKEGFENLEWVLLDYIDVVAHIFQREKREFYAVEELWGDAVDVPFKGK